MVRYRMKVVIHCRFVGGIFGPNFWLHFSLRKFLTEAFQVQGRQRYLLSVSLRQEAVCKIFDVIVQLGYFGEALEFSQTFSCI